MYSTILLFVSYYLRPIYKWFLRRTTGLCELQRICYGEVSGAPRTSAVEKSLMLSRSPQIVHLVNHLNEISDNRRFTGANEREILRRTVETVLLVKKIKPKVHFPFISSFSKCVEQIWGYRQLVSEVERLRKTNFNSDNPDHERKLYVLWENLMPGQVLEGRITKQWQDIGFQGDDPKTDFRGMGLLGLENLLFFAMEYKSAAQHCLSHSLHPTYGYAFAIVGINLTSMAWQLLREGDAKLCAYNSSKSLLTLRTFHRFYSFLFFEFDRYWIDSKPKNIMEFSVIRERFEREFKISLKDPNISFKINVPVDTV